jgi:hypothetical protein
MRAPGNWRNPVLTERYCTSRLSRVLLTVAVTGIFGISAFAGRVPWVNEGPFQACIETELDQWLRHQAQELVNETPPAKSLDDSGVAAWIVEAEARCRARAGLAEAGSVKRFESYMVRWRQHIHDLATEIRRQGQSD